MNKESIVNIILEVLQASADLMPRPFESKYAWARRLKNIDADRAYRALKNLEKQGLVGVAKKGKNHFITLTDKGELHILLKKAGIQITKNWDRKWRVVVFDIPEEAKHRRKEFRRLLALNGFFKLQASVYVSPYSLNRQAIAYLQKSGLMEYIRIMKVEEMDNDADLRKKFKLA